MARKQNDNLIIDFEDRTADPAEDLLAEKNRSILSSFGSGSLRDYSANNGNASAGGIRVSPLEALKARMNIKDTPAPAAVKEKPAPAIKPEPAIKAAAAERPAPAAKPEAEVKPAEKVTEKPAEKVASTEDKKPEAAPEGKETSLLEKLKRYTIDESGKDVSKNELPLYKLESVAEIIKSDSKKIIDRLSEKYNVTIDTLGKHNNDDYILESLEKAAPKSEPEEKPAEDKPAAEKPAAKIPTPGFKKLTAESKQRFEKNIFDELFKEDGEEDKKEPKRESVPDISDIDSVASKEAEKTHPPVSENATVRFTPIIDKHGNTGRINISSTTKLIDIKQELTSTPTGEEDAGTPFEMSDFDMFVQKGEVTDMAAAKSAVRRLAYKRRRLFITTALCAVCVFIMLLFFIPFLSNRIISSPKSTMGFCTALLFIMIAVNADMFADLVNLFKRKAGHDCMVSLCAAVSIPFCILSVMGAKNSFYLILLSAVVMLARSLANLMQTSALLSNLRQISSRGDKNALAFIKDNSTARAMAKDAVEGNVLIAAPRKAEFIADFMKYSSFKNKFSGKMPVVFAVTAVLAALGATVSFLFYKNVFDAITAAAITTMVAAMPALCFVDTLPLYCAAKKLNRKGAMLAGTFGADSVELANAAVVHIADIFPAGSITLKSLKVLSENDIDKTIVHAAALTEEAGSPLAPLFNKIAGTNTSYKKPDSDTIKYEEKLGLSGWVDNKLLFIGNRTLLEAHGIEVPDIEVDHRILRSGYFPVYVATGGVACALLVIEYHSNPAVRKLMNKVAKLGVTLLIENCDPNVSDKMITDYLGLYEGAVKVMTSVGVLMYKNAASDTSVISAPAAFKGSKMSLLHIICCASNIRKSNLILTAVYILSAIFGIWFFVSSSFASAGGLLSGGAMLAFTLISTLVALLAFLIKKP